MPTVRIQEKNYSESIMVLKLKDGNDERMKEVKQEMIWKLMQKMLANQDRTTRRIGIA